MASDPPAGPGDWDQFPTLRLRGGLAFIGVNTSVPKPPAMASGTAGEAQLARLAPLLADTGEQGLFRVVYLHHCPIPGHESRRKHLTDAPALKALLEAGGAELVLHGHGHRRYRDTLDTRDGAAPVVGIPSASALGLGGRQPAEYNRYRVERTNGGWRLDVASRHYDRESQQFVAGGVESVSLERRPRQ
jgi:3',5'-cyclic AMP phosphodiesterase CpdA